MNFEQMELNELKDFAKSIGISVGNIGKEKLIEKIKSTESDKKTLDSIMDDKDLEKPAINTVVDDDNKSPSLVNTIASVINDLENSDKDNNEDFEVLPPNTPIRVRSITFGGLTYISKKNNAMFRWNQIGAEEIMTIEQISEMNNYRREYLNRPMVILMDERAVRYFRLTKTYENVAKINDLKRVFSSSLDVIRTTIDLAIEVNMREVLVSKVSQMIKNKTLVDINVIKLLKEKLQYDFDELLNQVETE